MHCRLSSLCSVGLGSQVGRMSRIEEACLTGVVHLTLVKLAIPAAADGHDAMEVRFRVYLISAWKVPIAPLVLPSCRFIPGNVAVCLAIYMFWFNRRWLRRMVKIQSRTRHIQQRMQL
jgi:hypothetical protein